MIIAVTDACIFIDLIHLALLKHFFSLQMEIHTTVEVVNELYPVQQQALNGYIKTKRLIVHNLAQQDHKQILKKKYSRGLSDADKSVLWIATQLDAILITSDGLARKTAKRESIPCHGMVWILDQMVVLKLLGLADAMKKLTKLSQDNYMFNNNSRLKDAIKEKIEGWRKEL